MTALNSHYVRTSLESDGKGLFTSHYINEVLPQTKQFRKFHCNRLIAWVDGADGKEPLARVFGTHREHNERQIEDDLIRPILECLGNSVIAQVQLGSDTMDFCVFDGEEFDKDYKNTCAVVESKKYGRIESKYYIRREDNTDEVYQTLNYLRTTNLYLNNTGCDHDVDYAILTDGYRWRIYSKRYTHNNHEYEKHFIEFDLEAIVGIGDKAERDKWLKLFGIFLCKESLNGTLIRYQKESEALETAVTNELREQTFTALEYIATGIWRKIYVDHHPAYAAVAKSAYGIDIERARNDEDERALLLRMVYDESVVFLLRLLFVLYAEDRRFFDEKEIPRVIKGSGKLLDTIVSSGKAIGEVTDCSGIRRNDDVALGHVFAVIDERFNGGLFSRDKHPLLYDLDIDDALFAQAIDNLCRVQVRKHIYTVDFSTVSERELGSIYESLLEYKLAIMDEDVAEMPSIVNKRRIRRDVKKGDLYLINHKGERKATGSYYTPDLIVEHLVHTSLDPKLDEIKKHHGDSFGAVYDAVLELKICDPAMGSGHMIQACYSRILDFLRQTMEEMYEDGKTQRLWDLETSYEIRSQVARKCIYGADLNPTAVELAKLVMWIKVFRPDKPFEFFDYNLACGNSLIGVYDEADVPDDAVQTAMFRTREQVEKDIQADLLHRVSVMLDMPRDNVEQVHAVDAYWKGKVRPLQRQVSFFYNVKLAKWLLPEMEKKAEAGYDELIDGIEQDSDYVSKVIAGDPSIPGSVRALAEIDKRIVKEFRPLHWRIAFPHITVHGGFDVIMSNPPWDKVKPYRGEFFSDYIEGYDHMETKDAKAASDALVKANPVINGRWQAYQDSFVRQNSFYSDSYLHQTARDANGKILKGDNNLFKVFMEKVFTILRDGGTCGIVVPDALNIDNGCAGLRRLLLGETTIRELIVFENRKRLFDIDSRTKFDVLTFDKRKPRKNLAFDAGFYWYDPIWLDGKPDQDYIKRDNHSKSDYHFRYRYSTELIRTIDPDKLIIYEFRRKEQIGVLKKMIAFPKIGDETQSLGIRTYREFDMTNDSDLFNTEGRGWPLYQGKTVHHYDAHFNPFERWVAQGDGEARLSAKRNCDLKDLPGRKYRFAWRDVAQPTDNRSLIGTVVPRGCFVGNTLTLTEILQDGTPTNDNTLISGISVLLSSFIADFYVRLCMAKHVSAFILKQLPMPRDLYVLRQIGEMALPLYQGDDFDSFRDGIDQIDDEGQRNKLIAKLDARVAHLYGLTYEEYQSVLETFPLVDQDQKNRCLMAYNDWTFSLK